VTQYLTLEDVLEVAAWVWDQKPVPVRDAGLLDDSRDQRHQRFGMAALHRLRFLRDQLAGVGVQHAGGTGIQRGVDGEDQHGGMLTLFTAKNPTFSPSWPGLTRPSTPFAPSKNVDARDPSTPRLRRALRC